MRRIRPATFPVALVLALTIGYLGGVAADDSATAEAEDVLAQTYEHLETFAEALGYIETAYVDDIDPEQLIYGAIEGMMDRLDPHSTFMDPEAFAALQESTQGEYVGVGMEISARDEGVVIVTVFEGGPAFDIGVQAGDIVHAVDGEDAAEWDVPDVIRRLRGRRGERVELSVTRGDEVLSFEIVRDIIHLDAVEAELSVDGYGWLRVRSFQENASGEIRSAIDELESRNDGALSGLVLDLRNNPGGLLREAIAVADIFVDEGTIVSTAGRGGSQRQAWTANRRSTRYAGPLVVLVNGSSASASEIVAGALQDLQRAEVVGSKTFGKGSVQSIIGLNDGSGIKLTISRYYTPSGRSIHEAGIEPDLVLDVSETPSRPNDESLLTGPLYDSIEEIEDEVLREGFRRLAAP